MSDLDTLLNYDPLAEAEKLTGKSYKDDDATSKLGMLLNIAKDAALREIMAHRDDTYYGIPFADAVRIAEDEGFSIIASRTLTGKYRVGDSSTVTETAHYLWNPEGMLMVLESYGTGTGRAVVYYNLNFGDSIPNDYHKYTSTGCFADGPMQAGDKYPPAIPVWVGYHNVGEAMRNTLANLRSVGTLPVWKQRPFLWLLSYMEIDTRPEERDAVNAEVIAMFPESVQKAIAGE